MISDYIVRVQDDEGRGPFKPGFSHVWLDEERATLPPAIMHMRGFNRAIRKAQREKLFLGTAVIGLSNLSPWFSAAELLRLQTFGYRLVDCAACTIEASDDYQVLVSWRLPLRLLPALETRP